MSRFFKPENDFAVREALLQAGRQDLIGSVCDCLIPAQAPKAAIEARRRRANRSVRGDEDDDHYHVAPNPAKGKTRGDRESEQPKAKGYRPGRKSRRRREGKKANDGS